jgi:DNA-binding CsgD family transcriptional regulator
MAVLSFIKAWYGSAHGVLIVSTQTASRSVQLTPRELEIVELLVEGNTSKQIGESLGISIKTAEAHRANVMRKLALHSIVELVRYAIKNKIVEA